GVLSWWLLEQDRDVERQRVLVSLNRDVDLVATSLQNWLNEIDLALAALDQTSARPSADGMRQHFPGMDSEAVVVEFSPSAARAWPTRRLAYHPVLSAERVDEAGVARATALISEARDLRHAGRATESLAV